MRFVPGSLRAALIDRILAGTTGTAMTAMPATISFFDGVMPDAATLKTRLAAVPVPAGNPGNIGFWNAISPHQSQYMGSVAWRYYIQQLLRPTDVNEIELVLHSIGSVATTSAAGTGYESDPMITRQARIHRAGTPTWFALALSQGNSQNINTDTMPGNVSSQLNLAAFGTVGDENSDKDLKLIGGQIYLTQSSPVDLSRVPIISNVRIQLR